IRRFSTSRSLSFSGASPARCFRSSLGDLMVRNIGRILATFAVVGFALYGAHWLWIYYRVDPWTRDGRVRADIVQVTPDVSGLVAEVSVKDNQVVHIGDTLFAIDRERFRLALQ